MTDEPLLLGLRTAIHPTSDLDAAKAAFTALLGFGPYFDEPFYVGWQVGGYELALDPNGDADAGVAVYWGVADADAAAARLIAAGATVTEAVHDVGGGIRTAQFALPGGRRSLRDHREPALHARRGALLRPRTLTARLPGSATRFVPLPASASQKVRYRNRACRTF